MKKMMSSKKDNRVKRPTYYVEKIEECRKNKDTGNMEYHIKWKGYPR